MSKDDRNVLDFVKQNDTPHQSNRSSSASKHQPALAFFPEDWKEVVREMIEKYRETEAKSGKPLGFTKLRDRIMASEDKFVDGKLQRDTALTRQDLQNWILYGKMLTSPKFWYVDKFIRSLQIEDDIFFDGFCEYMDEKRKNALSNLYQSQQKGYRTALKRYTDSVAPCLFVSSIIPPDHRPIPFNKEEGSDINSRIGRARRIGLFIQPSETNVYSAIVIYIINEEADKRLCDSIKNAKFMHGYFIPQHAVKTGEIRGIVSTFTEDAFSSPRRGYRNFQCSYFHFEANHERLEISAFPSIDDPSSSSSHRTWRQTESRFSPFSLERKADDLTGKRPIKTPETVLEPTNYTADLGDYLENLKNRYIVW